MVAPPAPAGRAEPDRDASALTGLFAGAAADFQRAGSSQNFLSDGNADDEKNQAYHQEKKEQKLRDAGRSGGDSGKSEDRRDQSDNKKNQSPAQHNLSPPDKLIAARPNPARERRLCAGRFRKHYLLIPFKER